MIKNPVILFRRDLESEGEFDVCEATLQSFLYRSEVPAKSLVVGRYSVLPYYKELESELQQVGSRLINSYRQHRYIADIMNWYPDVKSFTPTTFETWSEQDLCGNGPWVVKGRTNSRKFQWSQLMYAESRPALLNIIGRLLDDTFIKEQGIVVRTYVPLRKLGEGLNGLPITAEWRFFFLGTTLLSSGFYWSTHSELAPLMPPAMRLFAEKIAKIVAKKVNFFVLDLAETAEGDTILIEINDGQMSGLSDNKSEALYSALRDALKTFKPNYC